MKKVIPVLSGIFMALVFILACISSTFDPRMGQYLNGYFGPLEFSVVFLRYIFFTVVIIVLCGFNRKNEKLFTIFLPLSLLLVMAAILYDYIFSHHLLYNYNYALWICASSSVASAALFLGATFFIKDFYLSFYRRFWLSYLILYLFIIYIAFIRLPDSYETTVNTIVGQGTMRFFKYMINNLDDSYMNLICLGNIFIFLPLPFIIRAIVPKLNIFIIAAIGAVFPILAESYQYVFRCGNVDVDDLILNWSGLIAGLILMNIIYKKKNPES